jgi:hypothetical protein
MTTDSYKETLDLLLLEAQLESPVRTSFRTLLRALGCPGVRYYNKCWHVDMPYAPSVQNSALVDRTMTAALQLHIDRLYEKGSDEDTLSILICLAKDDRWRACLKTIDSSYHLVRLLLEFTRIHAVPVSAMMPANRMLYMHTFPMIIPIFNAWVQPEVPLEQAPDADLLLRSMFGGVWCDLFTGSHISLLEVGDLISQQHPPFLPGLVTAQEYTTSQDLPLLF